MTASDIQAESAPPCLIPGSTAVCSLSIINTTCDLTVPSNTLIEPEIPGHELLNLPTLAFLIKNEKSGRQILFDLGCQKDFWNLPPPITATVDAKVPGIRVDKNLSEILIDGGAKLEDIEAAVISHHHYDHTGDPSTFPRSMDLLVGPGFTEAFMPGYPTQEASPFWEKALQGRNVREMKFEDGSLNVAGYRAIDYFQDGSFYILDSPGHAIGHISALVRTTANTFVFLGGDICHFGGTFRPTPYLPLPAELSGDEVGQKGVDRIQTSCFTACHPHQDHARTTPYYTPCSNAGSWYINPPVALQSIEKLKALDADERILVLIAHDPSVLEIAILFPNGTANDWVEKGWKARIRWRFLDELPVQGKERRFLVDGTYVDGKRVKDLDGNRIS